ncbi:hypothetical protein H5410_015699, partial [Solanum commersonii]
DLGLNPILFIRVLYGFRTNHRPLIMPVALCRNGTYDNIIASVIEANELACEPSNLVISYQMNGRGKIHPTFIKRMIIM